MRSFMALCLSLITASCCSTPLGPPDYSTPKATLMTFQEAFRNDAAYREYECFSLVLKKRLGSLDYKSYYDSRYQFIDDHPMMAFLFSLNDLDDNIMETEYRADGKEAWLTLSVGGEIIVIAFIEETFYHIEYLRARPQGDLIPEPHTKIVQKERELEITLPLSKRTRENFDEIQKILVEKRWMFLDFSFLHETISSSN